MARPSQRDRILDAYTGLVVETGPGSVTLEEVAACAGVSKGGLLYHFRSREALLDGLLARMTSTTTPTSSVRVQHQKGSLTTTGGLHCPRLSRTSRCTGHGLRLTRSRPMRHVLRCIQTWEDALAADLGDPLTARLVAVVGDGLHLRTMVGDTGDELTDPDVMLGSLRGVCSEAGA